MKKIKKTKETKGKIIKVRTLLKKTALLVILSVPINPKTASNIKR